MLDLLGEAGIGVDLATPTASPPPWLTTRYPDVLPVNAAGARYSHGSRQHFCVCSPTYREMARRIVERLAGRGGRPPGHRNVAPEQRVRLPRPVLLLRPPRPGVPALARAALRFGGSAQRGVGDGVLEPTLRRLRRGHAAPDDAHVWQPGQELDYRRFSNDAFLEEALEERAILKGCRPELPVTTNFMGFFKPLDYFAWASELDVASTDNYTDPSAAEWAMQSAMHYDLVRSLNKEVPWMVMEQTSSRVNWRDHNAAKVSWPNAGHELPGRRPGRHRACSFSNGERHGRGRKSSTRPCFPTLAWPPRCGRRWPASGGSWPGWARSKAHAVEARVALIFSWPNWWALEAPSKPANDLKMDDQLTWMYRPLYNNGITADFCRPDEAARALRGRARPQPLPGERSKRAPTWCRSWSRGDGRRSRSGRASSTTTTPSTWAPTAGRCARLMGCDVLEVAPLPAGETLEVEWEDGSRTNATFWADIAAEGDGRVLARIADGPWAGTAGRGRDRLTARGARTTWAPGSTRPAWHGSTPAFLRYPPRSSGSADA